MFDPLPLLRSLAAATTFEEAAHTILRALLARAQTACDDDFEGRGQMRRGMVHLRPDGGYRGLVVVEHGEQTASPPSGASMLPSLSAWRWAAASRAPVAVDVQLGHVSVLDPDGAEDVGRVTSGVDAFESGKSRVRLLDRGATHVLVLPTAAPGGSVQGMISLEAHCRSAMGSDFVWPSIRDDLERATELAAPFLTTLPIRGNVIAETDPLLPVIGESTAALVEVLRVFAAQDETLLIQGPTGSGKTRLARWCHTRSSRAEGPFEVADLLTIPEETQLAELFGWRRGAFTGAVADHVGHLGRAEGGTLFIDEIDKLSLRAQAGLLSVLEDRRYRPLGDDAARAADVRFIVGTNADLHEALAEGRFREDLYYRINVLPVRLPPLAERADEIPAWAAYMLERRHREGGGTGSATWSAQAELTLVSHRWPGNLRQLDNVIRRAYSLALVEYGARADDLVLHERHFAAALAHDARPGGATLLTSLELAAEAFLDEALVRPLDLDLAGVLAGFVIRAAQRRGANLEDTLARLGKEALLKNRNHHKLVRRELGRVIDLYRALGVEPPEDLRAYLGSDAN